MFPFREKPSQTEIASKSLPDCLLGKSEHSYDPSGVCISCGHNMLSETPLTKRIRLARCKKCNAIISVTAIHCPEIGCGQKVNRGLAIKLNLLYINLLEPLIFKPLIWPIVRILFIRGPSGLSFVEQVLFYAFVVLGILGSSVVRQGAQIIDLPSRGEFVAALITALVILPKVFQESETFDSETPLLNKVGIATQKGVFADFIIQAIIKIASSQP